MSETFLTSPWPEPIDYLGAVRDFITRDRETIASAAVNLLGLDASVDLSSTHPAVAFVCDAAKGGSPTLSSEAYYWQTEIVRPAVAQGDSAPNTAVAILSPTQFQAIGQDVMSDPACARPVRKFVLASRLAQSFGALCAAAVPVAAVAFGYGAWTKNSVVALAGLAVIPALLWVTKFTLFGQPMTNISCKRARRDLGKALPPRLVESWWRDNERGCVRPVVASQGDDLGGGTSAGVVVYDLAATAPKWEGTVLRLRAILKSPAVH